MMQYKYCDNENLEDYAGGRVLYSAEGVANFPVRLVNEIFGYAKEYSVKKDGLCVYAPRCGGGLFSLIFALTSFKAFGGF